ncbi:MAG: PadR family transcriptional regulator [Alphaproteobacteria bacterium]|nr:PadR family transcriptional regulator [Alphaproteobacteria bacterium]
MSEESVYTRKFRKELMAGLSSLVLLAVLARAGREMYGYEIAKAVKAEGEGGLIFKQGAIYPVLRSLNQLGLLNSRVEASAFGPPRRYYNITDDGLQALREWQGAWKDMREFVDDALNAQVQGAVYEARPSA